MCILFIAINKHPDYPLVIAANRDEFHVRPTKSLHFWTPQPNILAGQDLQAGGTWLGVNQVGNFAALTNIRNGLSRRDKAKTRGELVPLALQQPERINAQWLLDHCDNYEPFNLIYQSNQHLHCFNSTTKTNTLLEDGYHAICNGELDDVWPKMAKGEQGLEAIIDAHQPILVEQLVTLMQDTSQAPDHLLPNTGVGVKWERMLSSIFIQSNDYGTRSTAIILKHASGSLDFFEQSYTPDGSVFNKKQFALAHS